MQSLEESVVKAMDGADNELFAYFPYMLQDIWEFGADPDAIIQLTQKHCTNYHILKNDVLENKVLGATMVFKA